MENEKNPHDTAAVNDVRHFIGHHELQVLGGQLVSDEDAILYLYRAQNLVAEIICELLSVTFLSKGLGGWGFEGEIAKFVEFRSKFQRWSARVEVRAASYYGSKFLAP